MASTDSIASDSITEFQRRPLTRARELAAIRTHAQMRDWLAADGSPYATHPDAGMVQAAFLGAVQFQLDDLARAYEQAITRHA